MSLLRLESDALWRRIPTRARCSPGGPSFSQSRLGRFSSPAACPKEPGSGLVRRAVTPAASRPLTCSFSHWRTLTSAYLHSTGHPRRTAEHLTRSSVPLDAGTLQRCNPVSNDSPQTVSGAPHQGSGGARVRHPHGFPASKTVPSPSHGVPQHAKPARSLAPSQTFPGPAGCDRGTGRPEGGREAGSPLGRNPPSPSFSTGVHAQAGRRGRLHDSAAEGDVRPLVRQMPAEGFASHAVPEGCEPLDGGSASSRAASTPAPCEANRAFSQPLTHGKGDRSEPRGSPQGSGDRLSFSSIGNALRRAEKASRAVEVFQPRTASAAEVVAVARLCVDAETLDRSSEASASGTGDMAESWKQKVGVPVSAQITFLRKMASMPEGSVPVEDRHVRLFFETVTQNLLERLSVHRSIQARLLEEISRNKEDKEFQRMAESELSRSLLAFHRDSSDAAGVETPTAFSQRARALETSLEELASQNIEIRNAFVTAMWAFCILGTRRHLQTLGPAYASVLKSRLEQRDAGVGFRTQYGERVTRDTPNDERYLDSEDVECASGVLGYLRRARLPEAMEAILETLTRDSGACLSGLSSDDICHFLYETRPNTPPSGDRRSSNPTQKSREILLSRLAQHARNGLPSPSPVHAARAAISVVEFQGADRARIRDLLLDLLALVRPSLPRPTAGVCFSIRSSSSSPASSPKNAVQCLPSERRAGQGLEARPPVASLLSALPWITEEERRELQCVTLGELAGPKNLATVSTRDLIDVLADLDSMDVLREERRILEPLLREAIGRTLELSIPFNLRVAFRFFLLQRALPFSVPKFTEVFSACALKSAAAAEAARAQTRDADEEEAHAPPVTADLVLSLPEIEEACDLLEHLDAMNDLAPVAFARLLLLQLPTPAARGAPFQLPSSAPQGFETTEADVGEEGTRGSRAPASPRCRAGELEEQEQHSMLASWLRTAIRVLFLTVDTHCPLEGFSTTVMRYLVDAVRVSCASSPLRLDPLSALSADARVQCLWSLCVLDFHLVNDDFPACQIALFRPPASPAGDAREEGLLDARSAFLLQHLVETLDTELPTSCGRSGLSPDMQRRLQESLGALDRVLPTETDRETQAFRLVGFEQARRRMVDQIVAEINEIGVASVAAPPASVHGAPQPDLCLTFPPSSRASGDPVKKRGLLLLPLSGTAFSSVVSHPASSETAAQTENGKMWKQTGRQRLSAALAASWVDRRSEALESDGWTVRVITAEEWNAVKANPERRRRLLQQKLVRQMHTV
ncbi:conserved hypothetical protein [Neospora caninum Liverpool]|uniref:Uncharacterized protein n=1 Tax=Neospora caninum (strain Liverpool) TaxID=572307 RepID=F0VK76_NEOCL|nr:conserved hypothetical protein [Neospora caninum Liverpool]CBZ54477.1 conserved hypothetical protein [Neospora caninum Liverpool]|eukprot:XP_003884507.1 conserved hypothetical protein [Neospora caninum Liverpool]